MKIRTATYAGTVVRPGDPAPDALPQIAFSGRSNVGKSSLINSLLNRTRAKIARVSGTPGKTQALNFYRVNDRFLLVDLPGYGFAQVPESVRDGWARLIEGYLAATQEIRGVVHLVDARHSPTKHDHRMVAYLAELELPTLIVLNKIDKLSRSRRAATWRRAMEELGVDEAQLLAYSSKTGEGRQELLAALEALIHEPATESEQRHGSGS
ncbi:MAG: ribosome biogenesis GTP-binding protein YihA/YsxC [Gemmatimonadota bacterium]|nr:ribosome biogenesis GTP-binding protein YihA/YsxC [Gemmatimonadota bacterium]